VVCLIIFKQQLIKAAGRINRLKYKDLEIGFSCVKQLAEENRSEIQMVAKPIESPVLIFCRRPNLGSS
jgi:hypothetical protein